MKKKKRVKKPSAGTRRGGGRIGGGFKCFFSRLTRRRLLRGVNKKQMLFNNNKGVGRNHTYAPVERRGRHRRARTRTPRPAYLRVLCAHTYLPTRVRYVCTHLRPGVDFLPLAESGFRRGITYKNLGAEGFLKRVIN